MSLKRLSFAAAVLMSSSVLLWAAPQNQITSEQAAKKPAATTQPSQQHQDEGDRIFQQQCARCHNAPEGFSSRISGTIVRHMRVRASLSKQDEEQLLHFLNP
jgi:mono/diheme cytochrome c family protein